MCAILVIFKKRTKTEENGWNFVSSILSRMAIDTGFIFEIESKLRLCPKKGLKDNEENAEKSKNEVSL